MYKIARFKQKIYVNVNETTGNLFCRSSSQTVGLAQKGVKGHVSSIGIIPFLHEADELSMKSPYSVGDGCIVYRCLAILCR